MLMHCRDRSPLFLPPRPLSIPPSLPLFRKCIGNATRFALDVSHSTVLKRIAPLKLKIGFQTGRIGAAVRSFYSKGSQQKLSLADS